MQEKEYPLMDSDVPTIIEELIALKLIELAQIKCPDKDGRINDPNYCKYYRLVGHSI